MNKSTFITVFAALIVGFLLNSFFIVNEKEEAIVFQFGEAVRTDIDVGFHFKVPVIQEVKKYDSRIQTLDEQFEGVMFLGIVLRGGTTHYELVTNETFRSIGDLALDFPKIAIINNVVCVENKEQLLERLTVNTKNNAEALKKLINEKSS